VSQRANGEVFDVWLPRGMKPAMANILLTLVGEAQLVRPAQARTAWIVEERDINGAYMAAYQETAPGRFHKQKARYLDVATAVPGAAAPAQPQLRIDRSDIDLVADTHDRLVELRADDAMTVTFSGLSFNVRLRFSLAEPVALSNSVAIGDFARVKAELEPHPMAQLGLDPVAEAARQDRALLAGASGDMLVAELRALPSDAPRGRAASALLARWEALLRLEPTTADRARGLVLSEPALQGKLMVDALSSAGTDQAQSALAAIAADPGARTTLRLSATQYLGLQRSPAPAAVSGLRALLDDHNRELAQSAVLALGACARSLRATAPDRARELVGELHRRLAGVRSAEARQDLVVALGNAGDPSSLPILRGLIESESPRQTETDHGGNPRLVAVEALRFIEDPAVDPLLGSLLERASDASGRFAAITAIRFRNIGPFAAQLAEIARRPGRTPPVRRHRPPRQSLR